VGRHERLSTCGSDRLEGESKEKQKDQRKTAIAEDGDAWLGSDTIRSRLCEVKASGEKRLHHFCHMEF